MKFRLAEKHWTNTAAFKDLVMVIVIAIEAIVLVEALELVDAIYRVAEKYEAWLIDELITVPVILAFAFGAYSLRRWKELRHEMTEHKKAEYELRLAEERYRTIFENSAVAITMTDEQERLISWNKFMENLVGMDGEDLHLKPVKSLYPPEEWKKIRSQNVRQKGMQHHLETRMIKKDGEIIDIDVSLSVLKNSDGKTTGSVGVVRDITERKKADKMLRQIQAAVDDATDAIVIIDREGRAIYANVAFGELFKYTIDGINEAGLSSIFVDSQVAVEVYQGALKLDHWTGDVQVVSSEGRVFPAFLRCTPITDDVSNIVGILLTINDITELKQAQERQAQLLEEVRNANQELKDFAYIVSHDLKAPLRAIETLSSWISTDHSDRLDEEGREQMHLLTSQVERMHNLIDGVLQYSRVGRVKEKKVQVNLSELVSEIIDAVASPENIAITVEDELPVVECDETRIMQVFQNLLSNAVKYMDKPQGRIKIGCVEEAGFWKFSVADNGRGIEEKHFKRIFQIFQTLSPGKKFESTGIGLTIVKRIVELYGGEIWVESKPGEGSTFFFTLPKQKNEVVYNAKLEANIAC